MQTNTRLSDSKLTGSGAFNRKADDFRLPDGIRPSIADPAAAYERKAAGDEEKRITAHAEKETFAQQTLWEGKPADRLQVVGQLHGTYVICESKDGMVLIDQHAAHERIYYEQLKRRRAGRTVPSQKLLVPEMMDLGYKEAGVLMKITEELAALGLEIEPFGGSTFAVKSVPAILAEREIKPLVQEMVDKLLDVGFSGGIENTLDQCLILMACHGTVRAHQRLSENEMQQLIEQLERCDNPDHCPHGRPIKVSWSLQTLEKAFKRIV